VKTKALFPFLLLLLCSQAFSQDIRQVLVLGDSHLNGEFGESLQRKLHDAGKYDILSIAIGGAGSRHFTMTMKNHCCGFKIRESCAGEVIPAKTKIRTIEKASTLTNEIVGKTYKGQLKNVVAQLQPQYVIVALGNNFVNDHQTLVSIIKDNAPLAKIIWVGPVLRTNFEPRIKAIEQVVNKNKLFLVRSDDIIGSDTLTSTHFYGKTAQSWAGKVVERMKPALK